MSIKQQLHEYCKSIIRERLANIRAALSHAQEAANEETKSSAGDKHETGRAMMQLETEQLNAQLNEALKEEERLQRIHPTKSCNTVKEGALVKISGMNLYFAISAGKKLLNGNEYIILSEVSPLGQAMKNLQAGDQYEFRGRKEVISSIE